MSDILLYSTIIKDILVNVAILLLNQNVINWRRYDEYYMNRPLVLINFIRLDSERFKFEK